MVMRNGSSWDTKSTPVASLDVAHSTEIVDPEDTQVMESRARPELTLITCYPFSFVGAAPKRFVVHARPIRSAPAKQVLEGY
jgi:sortase A